MRANGVILLRGVDGSQVTYEGSFVVADGGVWFRPGSGKLSGANLVQALGADPGAGAWLFVPMHAVAALTTDDDPTE